MAALHASMDHPERNGKPPPDADALGEIAQPAV